MQFVVTIYFHESVTPVRKNYENVVAALTVAQSYTHQPKVRKVELSVILHTFVRVGD